MIAYIFAIITLPYYFSCIAMNKEAIPLFYKLAGQSSYETCSINHCKLHNTDDIFYTTRDLINLFNSMFNTTWPYNTPFVSIMASKDKFGNNKVECLMQGERWPMKTWGIPLPLLEREVIILGSYHLQKTGPIDCKKLNKTFAKYPLGHAHCSKYENYPIAYLLEQEIIEKNGDGYMHGSNSFFASNALVASRISDFVQKNNQYSTIVFCVSLSRT